MNVDNGQSGTATTLTDFVMELIRIDNEKKLLNEDRKAIVADYKDKLDVKTVQAAIRFVRMRSKLDVSDEEFDNIVGALQRHINV
jgi:uncharacterized protein (UPF0335 family)